MMTTMAIRYNIRTWAFGSKQLFAAIRIFFKQTHNTTQQTNIRTVFPLILSLSKQCEFFVRNDKKNKFNCMRHCELLHNKVKHQTNYVDVQTSCDQSCCCCFHSISLFNSNRFVFKLIAIIAINVNLFDKKRFLFFGRNDNVSSIFQIKCIIWMHLHSMRAGNVAIVAFGFHAQINSIVDEFHCKSCYRIVLWIYHEILINCEMILFVLYSKKWLKTPFLLLEFQNQRSNEMYIESYQMYSIILNEWIPATFV